jgi:hypothetical protein
MTPFLLALVLATDAFPKFEVDPKFKTDPNFSGDMTTELAEIPKISDEEPEAIVIERGTVQADIGNGVEFVAVPSGVYMNALAYQVLEERFGALQKLNVDLKTQNEFMLAETDRIVVEVNDFREKELWLIAGTALVALAAGLAAGALLASR